MAFSNQEIREYAELFASTFAKKGIGVSGANISKINSANIGIPDRSGVTLSKDASGMLEHSVAKAKYALMQKNNRILEEYIDLQDRVNKGTEDEEKSKKRLRKLERNLETDSIFLGDSFKSAAKAIKDKRLDATKALEFIKEEDIDKLNKNFDVKMKKATDEYVEVVEETTQLWKKRASSVIENSLSDIAIKGMFSASVLNFTNQVRSSFKYGADTVGGLGTAFDALRLGVSPSELMEMGNNNRRLVQSVGGTASYQEKLVKVARDNFKYYGDLGESAKSSTQMLNALALGGVDVNSQLANNAAGLKRYNKTFESIRNLTGETFGEQAAQLEEYVKNDVVKNRLAAASNSAERSTIIQRGLATRELLKGLGLTAEQAQRAGEALNGIAGLDPKERLIESYRAQAVISAMGIENAELVGKAMRAGGVENLKSPEEREKATRALAEMARKHATAMSSEVDGITLTNSTLMGYAQGALNMAKGLTDVALASEKKAQEDKEKNAKIQDKNDDSLFTGLMENTLPLVDIFKTGIVSNALLTGIGFTTQMILRTLKQQRSGGIGGSEDFDDFDDLRKDKNRKDGKVKRQDSKSKRSGRVKRKDSIFDSKSKRSGKLGRVAQYTSKLKNSSMLSGVGNMVNGLNLGKAASFGGKMLEGGAKLVTKAFPIASIASSIYSGVKGVMNADKVFNTNETTLGMKAAAGIGGALEGLSFGILDASSTAKGLYKAADYITEGFNSTVKAGMGFGETKNIIDTNLANTGIVKPNHETQNLTQTQNTVSPKDMTMGVLKYDTNNNILKNDEKSVNAKGSKTRITDDGYNQSVVEKLEAQIEMLKEMISVQRDNVDVNNKSLQIATDMKNIQLQQFQPNNIFSGGISFDNNRDI